MVKRMKKAFTLLEMIIVMVVLGIIANFGVEIVVNAYENYIFTSVQNRLQSESEAAVKQIANRLEYRIKESVMAENEAGLIVELVSALPTMNATILEWVSSDREGWLGNTNMPLWSGFIDINNAATATGVTLVSPMSNTAQITTLINTLSAAGGASGLSNAALYSIDGSFCNPMNSFGWSGALATQSLCMHRITAGTNSNEFAPHAGTGNFISDDSISEFYQLAWTAYAVRFEDRDGDGNNELWLYYDFQPWEGETYANGDSAQLMDNITTFAFKADGDVISIQVCVSDDDIFGEGAYSICKEKTVF